ncbi:alpha/beta hydrolase [Neobacillus pocheonensis]|uniref:alpha/beta fold hydrolase n=1 Tax=Neobacillus pocheonensis TaxID=363869 RepID=UPI003D2709EF
MFTRKTALIHKENAISELKPIKLGGIQQWISIRAEDKSKPVLLFLHGGPGTGQIGIIGDYQKELEKHFIVVNWDQRGAGLSYTKEVAKTELKIEQLLNDTLGLINFLKKEFHQEKIYLIGHSWGTILGLLAIHRHPEHFHHYIGISQVISMSKIEEVSYELVLEKAKELNNQKAVTQLTEIGKPPWRNLKHDRIHQRYVDLFGGGISHNGKLVNTFLKKLLKSKEYTFLDIVRFFKGQYFSLTQLMGEMRKLDLSEEVQQLDVPITLIMGRHDLQVPTETARGWFDSVDAKNKTWVWFEKSAHSPLFEENDKFVELVLTQTQR